MQLQGDITVQADVMCAVYFVVEDAGSVEVGHHEAVEGGSYPRALREDV